MVPTFRVLAKMIICGLQLEGSWEGHENASKIFPRDRVADPDPYRSALFGNLDPDPQKQDPYPQSEKKDADPDRH